MTYWLLSKQISIDLRGKKKDYEVTFDLRGKKKKDYEVSFKRNNWAAAATVNEFKSF